MAPGESRDSGEQRKEDAVAISVATLDGGRTNVDDAALQELRATILGDVLRPGDPGFGDRPIFNAMHQRRPALIVRCAGTADVVDAVKFARQQGLLVAVRGGGHSVAGHSSCDGGLVIDLTRMRGVDLDPEAKIARVQGGALWRDVDRETQAFGLIVPGGVVSETGVAGLTLGGGEGWVRRKYGLTIDSLVSARVVGADASVYTASARSEPDLFWALRGGGGNFGVVTSFEFRAHPLGPMVAFAGVFYPVTAAATILPRWRDYCATAPDEVTSVALAITMPADPNLPAAIHNQACLVVGGVYAGEPSEGMGIMQPLRELGQPLADISQPMPFTAVQTAFDPLFPMGKLRSYWKAQNLGSLPDKAIDIIATRANQRPSPLTLVVTFQMGGRINQVGPTDTAYAERSAPWMSSIDGNWENSADNEANIAWVRESFRQIAPFSTGTTYTNFTGQSDETAGALAATAYGANMARLRRIKARYDPGNFFRLNANVSPAP
jgi:FAD/FMN-containing dehydrogenase